VSWLGVVAGALSLVALIERGLKLGFTAPLESMLEFYKHCLGLMLDWAVPYLNAVLRFSLAWIGWKPHLYPHWRDVFVLMWLYFGGDVKSFLARNRPASVLATIGFGGLIALAASVASGVVMLDDPSMLAIILPIFGFVLYEVGQAAWAGIFQRPEGKTWLQTFRFNFVGYALTDMIIGVAAILAAWESRHRGIPNPNLVLLLVFVLALAFRNVGLGAWLAMAENSKWFDPLPNRPTGSGENGAWTNRFFSSATTRLGLLIMSVLAGTTLFVALNAGLRFFGF
jgi:hypothetical protein